MGVDERAVGAGKEAKMPCPMRCRPAQETGRQGWRSMMYAFSSVNFGFACLPARQVPWSPPRCQSFMAEFYGGIWKLNFQIAPIIDHRGHPAREETDGEWEEKREKG